MEGKPLAGRTIVVKFEIRIMVMTQINTDTDRQVIRDNSEQNYIEPDRPGR